MHMEKLLSVVDVARALGVSERTVREMVKRGELMVAVRTEGTGARLFRHAEVERVRRARERAERKAQRQAAQSPREAVAP